MFRNKALLLLVLMASIFSSTAWAKVASLEGKEPFVPGEILVRFKDSASPQDRAKAMVGVGTSQPLNHPTLVKVKLKAGMDVPGAIAQMRNDTSVQYVQPNYRYYALSCGPPTDQFYATPVTNSSGVTVLANWPFTKIQAPQAWALISSCVIPPGAGSASVTVAVLDSGISRNNPDLKTVPLIGYNAIGAVGEQDSSCTVCGYNGPSYVDSVSCTCSMDDFAHGTYVAGIIGAQWGGNNLESVCPGGTYTTGMAGVAPGCTLLAVKVLDCTGVGTSDSIVAGTNYAVAHGARVLNFSLGSPASGGLDQAEQEALDNALANNCVIVAASGNESYSGHLAAVDYPAAYPPVISVGATDESDNLAFYSNGGANLKIVAPGGYGEGALSEGTTFSPELDIFSDLLCPLSTAAVSDGGFITMPGDSNFGTAAGTSAAAPFVSGAAALILSVYPTLTNTQVAQAIINNTDSLNGNQGWNPQTGYGRLNIYRALLGAGNGGGQVISYLETFNSPNPFYTKTNGSTNITVAISQPAPVELTIRDSSGELVFHKNYDPGELNNNPSNPQFKSYYVSWDGRNGAGQPVVTGIYFYAIKVNGQVGRNKIALIQGGK